MTDDELELDELMLLSPEDLTRLQALRRCYDLLRAGGRGHEEAKGYLARRWVEYGGDLRPGDLERATSDAFAGGCAPAPTRSKPPSPAVARRMIDNIRQEANDRGHDLTREQVIEWIVERQPEKAALLGLGLTVEG